MKEIPLSVPNLSSDIVENLRECIKTGWVSSGGKYIVEFEKKLACYLNVDEVVGVQSGTAALHLVYKYFNFTGCEVICPTVTFVASINPLLYESASPVFMDCDDTLNMDLDKLEDFCFYCCDFIDGKLINRRTKKHVKGLVVVHVFGNPINMERVLDIARFYNLIVIEDAAEALGSYYTKGEYKNKYCGTIGDAGIISFNANKIITTGGGGVIVSSNKDLLNKVRFWSVQSKTNPLTFVHDEIGYNYRMLNINAALGVSQLEKLEEFIETKKQNYQKYQKYLNHIKGLRLLPFNENTRSNNWFYSLIVDNPFPESRDELLKRLADNKIQTRPLWNLMHEQKHLKDFEAYKIEKAQYYQEHLLNIPCSTDLNEEEILHVASLLDIEKEPLVSVITPVYNSERFIKETIESVLNQTYTNLELIIVDDASIDNSTEIIRTYRERDTRIKYIRNTKNSGAAISRNIALENAKGRFIAFLDSDDIWDERKLEVQIAYMRKHKIGFSFTSYQIMDADGKVYERIIKAPDKVNYHYLLKNTIIGCLTVVLDRNIIGDIRMPIVRSSQDFATWLSILKNGHVAYGIKEVLAKYRKVNGSLSSNKLKALRSNWLVYRKIEKLSLVKACYVFIFYVLHALKKHVLLH